jgi:DNA-binding response OmpR family regulator
MAVATAGALRRVPNVLVIDTDLAFHAFVNKALIGKFAREVLATRSMSEAANHIRSGKVDICLFEPEVCRKTNVDFARWLRDPHACPHTEVPLVLLTASGDKAMLAKVGQFGIEGVIRKPIQGNVLISRLTTIITERKRFIWADGYVGEDRRKEEIANFVGQARRHYEVQAEALIKSGEAIAPVIERLAESVVLEAPVKKEAQPLPVMELPTTRPAAAPPPPPSPPPVRQAAPAPTPKPVLSSGPIELAPPPVTPAPKSGGRLSEEDLLPIEKKVKKTSSNEDWLAEIAAEHRERPEPPQIDIAKLVAEHNLWLSTKGEQGVRASFADKDIAGVDFSGIALTNADFRNVVMSDAICVEAHFDGADFRNADLSATNFTKAILSVARMRHVNLSLANLSEADLKHADLSGAKFAKACCEGANLTGAILLGADLRDADLSSVEGLKQAQLDKVIGDHTTKLPAGLFLSS